uniref:Eukaryotic translation initiation factor 4 gamma 3 n=1 Tax=Culex pipiens TaxID=7175 RepID=A0A8D8CN79_CULPI
MGPKMSSSSQQQQQQPLSGRSSQQRHIPQSAPAPRGGPSGSTTMSKSGSGQLYQQQQLPQFAIPKDAVRRNFPHPDASTDEKLKKFSKTVHLEMDATDIVESVKMLEEINPDYYHAAITELFMDNIERDAKSREAVVKVIAQMFEQKIVGKADYLHALEEVFKLADDLIIDLPQLYKCIATFYVKFLHGRQIDLADLQNVAQPILASYGGVMLREVLHQYEGTYGQSATVMLWLSSSLNFADFIQLGSADKVEQYLRDNKLDYLLNSGSNALDMQTVGTQIKQFLKSGAKFVEIFGWVAEYVGPERVTSDEFIRTLTKAVIEHCIDNKTKLNVQEITKWHQILQKYIDSKPERELQAMYAIQRLVVELEHPQNLLHTILEQLYDNDVIMEGFSLWKDSQDPLEAAGKGVCLKGITQFMTMFMENSSDEDN